MAFADDEDESSSADEGEEEGAEEMKMCPLEKSPNDKAIAAQETEAGAEISALVNYVQPVHFTSFENSESEYYILIKMRLLFFFI